MADIDLTQAGQDAAHLATNLFHESAEPAIQDGQAFLAGVQARLLEYRAALDRGEIDQEQFEELANEDLPALAAMQNLKTEGFGQIEIDRFTAGLVQIAIKAVIAAAL